MADIVDPSPPLANYTVVARRYRPKTFDELVGQEHIAHALTNAIATRRVGHAYLFTGARGVGKTSTARIFAKALSVTEAMSREEIDEICAAIDAGDDMDVLEIDGASNRGIEEIRQLRSNVHVRPIRAQYKVYIIDEVHMLTTPAFNALLKTLEEPPEHVKFIFCTTDPNKIPITVLSRCQRFDFVPVKLEAIQQRLREIAQQEGFQIDSDSLSLLARQASGSMRDSQSLLEQVMSFSDGEISAQQVHAILGTADEENLWSIVEAMRDRNPLSALEAVHGAIAGGADAGQLAEQLLNYLRDLMTLAIGGHPQMLKFANPASHARLKQLADSWGLQTLLSAIQILDESLVRMRASVSAITLMEVALVQISQLEQLVSIPALLEALQTNAQAGAPPKASHPPGAVEKKKLTTDELTTQPTVETAVETTAGQQDREPSVPQTPDSPADALSTWLQLTRSIEGILSDYCQLAESVQPQSESLWHVIFPPGANQPRDYCEQTQRKTLLMDKLRESLGREIQLVFELKPGPARQAAPPPPSSSVQRTKKFRELALHPLVKKVCEMLDGEIVRHHSAHPKHSANGRLGGQAAGVAAHEKRITV